MTALPAERLAEIRRTTEDEDARYPYHPATGIFPGEVLALLDEVDKMRKLALSLYGFLLPEFPNYLQLDLETEAAGRFVAIVARSGEQTPHALRLKAEAERDALQKRLDSAEVYNNAVEEERKRIGKQLSDAKAEWAERCKRQEAGLRDALARAEKAEAALAKARVALTEIRDMPNDSLWMDDRDDAADCMVEIAHAALEAK